MAQSQQGERSSDANSSSSANRDDGLRFEMKEEGRAETILDIDGRTSEIATQDDSQPQDSQDDSHLQENSLFLWVNDIVNAKVETENKQQQGFKIPKIPDVLLKNTTDNGQDYAPSVVSIGPYHYNDKLPEKLKLIKDTMVHQFVKESGKSTGEVYREVNILYSNSKKLKKYYDPKSIANLKDREFTKMMFVDGCFILQFITSVMHKHDDFNLSNQEVALVKRDLLLLENQLPYEVLRTLMNLQSKAKGPNAEATSKKLILEWDELIKDFIKVPEPWKPLQKNIIEYLIAIFLVCVCAPIGMFVCCCFMCPAYCLAYLFPERFMLCLGSWMPQGAKDKITKKMEQELDNVEIKYAHLAERLYDQFINKNTKLNDVPENDGPYLYYSAKALKKVGIYFKPSRTSAFTDVMFKPKLLSGILELPPITIDEYTKAMLLNLVAYETCVYESKEHWVTAYICLMDSLINDAEDVKELRSNGIICNFLATDEMVANLFNGIASDLVPNPLAYREVKRKINSQCQSTVKKWVAEFRQLYFSSPWTFIAVVAATFAIILTAIQTYLAAFPA